VAEALGLTAADVIQVLSFLAGVSVKLYRPRANLYFLPFQPVTSQSCRPSYDVYNFIFQMEAE